MPANSRIRDTTKNLALAGIQNHLSECGGDGTCDRACAWIWGILGTLAQKYPRFRRKMSLFCPRFNWFWRFRQTRTEKRDRLHFRDLGGANCRFLSGSGGGAAFLAGNSIGCVAIMQAAVDHPDFVLGVAAINCSLRLLHERKRGKLPWYRRLGADIAQIILKNKAIGAFFFQQIAKPQTVRKILLQAYRRSEAVTEELVEIILKPARDQGAIEVFLAFTGYSGGPLPEDLLPILPCPAILLWGSEDPWEPSALGEELAGFPTVKQFIPLAGLGHCPQDKAPEIVNPILLDFLQAPI